MPKVATGAIEGHATTLDKYLKSAYAYLKDKGKLTFDLMNLNQNVADAKTALAALEGMLTGAKDFSQLPKPMKRTVAKGKGKRTPKATGTLPSDAV